MAERNLVVLLIIQHRHPNASYRIIATEEQSNSNKIEESLQLIFAI